METVAVVLKEPEAIALATLPLTPPGPDDSVIDIAWSGISTGTEKLLWTGRMPPFPGMGYPLVPGYESVGRIAAADRDSALAPGTWVFVPGANCFGDVRGLFGGAAAHLVVPTRRLVPVSESLGDKSVLLALAATAHRAAPLDEPPPGLIVGHGVLGRLIARLAVLAGGNPTVWERDPARRDGAKGYIVVDPDTDPRGDYARICDVSGDPAILDTLIGRLSAGGEIVLAGFYAERLSFAFPPAFMREARLRVAAQWQPADLETVRRLAEDGRLALDGLITHRRPAADAESAYRIAFGDPSCLKMILDWRVPK